MTDDLTEMRDRLAEALTREHYRRADERLAASVEEHCTAFADAVMAVVEPELAERDALKAELAVHVGCRRDISIGDLLAALDHPTEETGRG